MSTLGSYIKQPRERESYTIVYAEDLTAGDAVRVATAEVEPPGLIIDDVFAFPDRVRFWVRGGSAGTKYKVTVLAETEDGRTLEDEVLIKVKDY